MLGSTTFTQADLDDAAVREVAGVTGLSLHRAGVWIGTADRLCGSMPRIVDALAVGRLDLARATTVADECTGLTDAQALVVERAVLEALPAPVLDGTVPVGPWDVMSPRAFTAMVKKAVAGVRTDTDEAIAAEVRERTGTWLEIDRANPALAVWTITGPTEQLVAAEEAAAATVRAMTPEELAGRTHGTAKVDLITDALLNGGGVGGPVSVVRREVGVVINLDTLTGDGPAAQAAGEVRGTGHPVPVTAAVARVLTAAPWPAAPARASSSPTTPATCRDVLRVGVAPENGWTRQALIDAARGPRCDGNRRTAPHRLLHTHHRDRRHRGRPRPGLHLPRLRGPGRAVRPGPRRPAPARTHRRAQPQPQIPQVPPAQDRSPVALPHAPIPLRRRDRARVDQPTRPPPGRRGHHPARVLITGHPGR